MTKDSLIKELQSISGEVTKIVQNFIDFNEEYGATYTKLKEWKGYNVYSPNYNKDVTIGYPYVILAKKGEMRLSTEKESVELLDVE